MLEENNLNNSDLMNNQDEEFSADFLEAEDFSDSSVKEKRVKEKSTKAEIVDDFKMTVQELPAACEAVLFVSGDAVSLSKLEEVFGCDRKLISDAMNKLISDYANNPWGGLMIRKIEETYVMCTKPAENRVIERLFMPKMRPPLSQASYETLAVIAYNQPVTRAQVESVRGVSSDSIISRLLDRGWIFESGTLDAPGRPTLFSTTDQFLKEFGIESADALPAMELMSYKTIRDLEDSLEDAAGNGDKKQLTIDGLIESETVGHSDLKQNIEVLSREEGNT